MPLDEHRAFHQGDIVRHVLSDRVGVVLLVARYSATEDPGLYELHVDTDAGVEIWELSDAKVMSDEESSAEVRRLGLRGRPDMT